MSGAGENDGNLFLKQGIQHPKMIIAFVKSHLLFFQDCG
jgi:hypothetical protein